MGLSITSIPKRRVERVATRAIGILGLLANEITELRTTEEVIAVDDLCEDEIQMVVEFLQEPDTKRLWTAYVNFINQKNKKKRARTS